MRKFVVLVLFLSIYSCIGDTSQTIWQDLFDGETLNGWVQKNGQASYKVENGVIIGTTVLEEHNSFLCTEKNYSNFILELELKVNPQMNSGIQIRSNQYEEAKKVSLNYGEKTFEMDVPKGRVYGYQIEIDPSDRAWSGGIYHEAGRGWLYNLENNTIAQKAFNKDGWNHYRIEAIGDVIRTWINGVPAAFLVDPKGEESGFIALQVHQSKEAGMQVMWRNIRIIDLGDETKEFPAKVVK